MVLSICKVIDIFSKSKKKTLLCLLLVLVLPVVASAQGLNARFLAYIEQYKDVAMEHCRTHGVPASITLAQGLLESNAGNSYLATRGNNHFGIKCHKWAGEVVEYDDTLQHDCYRKYGSPEDSFLDHSRFLCARRYQPLHELDITDYRGWADGLRTCGYAEDPAYPQKLISIIERYTLHRYDSIAFVPGTSAETSQKPKKEPKQTIDTKGSKKQKVEPVTRVAAGREKPADTQPASTTSSAVSVAKSKTKTKVEDKASPLPPPPTKQDLPKRQRNKRPNTTTGKPLTGSADNDD